LGWVLAIATCALLTWYGALATWDNYAKNAYDFFKLPDVSIFYVYLIIPFGSLLWLIQLLRRQSRPGSGPVAASNDRGGEL
jgi:TRAP-type C4-dicarboxylate transport system permease small subunit